VRLQLRIATLPRAALPEADDALGNALLDELFARLVRGPAAPSLMVFEADRVLAVDVREALRLLRHQALVHRFVASFAGIPGVQAVAAVGPMRRGVRPAQGGAPADPGVPLGGVFLEWPDGRWWGGWRPLDTNGRPMPTDSDDVQRAVDGASRPAGLGGWFSRARFEGLRAELRASEPADPLVN
jgi:hypothetical protein